MITSSKCSTNVAGEITSEREKGWNSCNLADEITS